MVSNTSRLIHRLLRSSPPPAALIFILLIALPRPLTAQSTVGSERAQIEARINQLEGQIAEAKDDDAKELSAKIGELRHRLYEGDFRAGDAIALSVRDEQQLTDTFTVDPPRELRLPGMAPMDLTGVLWDEIGPYLQNELSRYLRNPDVTAHALLRLGVLGAVGQPGYYVFRQEIPVQEVFGAAGGLAQNAKVENAEVRRRGDAVIGSKTLRIAMADGWNLQRLQVRAGDEIYVPAAGPGVGAVQWVYVLTGLVGVGLALYAVF